jgi:amino acid permease
MSIFKIFLMLGLMMYTFITMVGGNPDHHAYGFTYWKNPVCVSVFTFSDICLLFPVAHDV